MFDVRFLGILALRPRESSKDRATQRKGISRGRTEFGLFDPANLADLPLGGLAGSRPDAILTCLFAL